MTDDVNHPKHYKFSNGAEVIDITENLINNRGNAVKYLARAGEKDPTPAGELKDLRKAQWYVNREIGRFLGEHPELREENSVEQSS